MASLTFEEARDVLKEENEEFARLYQKHRELDANILELEERRYLTPEEEIQEKKMKKDKLRIKDTMAAMVQEYLTHKEA